MGGHGRTVSSAAWVHREQVAGSWGASQPGIRGGSDCLGVGGAGTGRMGAWSAGTVAEALAQMMRHRSRHCCRQAPPEMSLPEVSRSCRLETGTSGDVTSGG
jgi:hypothetical protein